MTYRAIRRKSARRFIAPALLAALVFLASNTAHSQLKLGQQVPALHLGPIVYGDDNVPVAGHAMLIEFWATWCAPCREQIPHLNDLVRQFHARGIDFVSLTCEPSKTVRAFLKEHPIEGTVAIDPDCEIADAIGSPGLPTTVLIDSRRRLAAVTRPHDVNPDVLDALLIHTDLPLSIQQLDTRPEYSHNLLINKPPREDQDADVRIVIRRVDQPGYGAGGSHEYETEGSSLADMIALAYGTSRTRVEVPTALAGEFFSMQTWVPHDRAGTLQPLMQAGLAAAAGIRVHSEQRQTQVWVLTGFPGKLSPTTSPTISCGSDRGNITLKGCTAEMLRESIENVLGRIVILDNPPPGRFNAEIRWNAARPADLPSILHENLGLDLNRESRQIEFFVVEALAPERQQTAH